MVEWSECPTEYLRNTDKSNVYMRLTLIAWAKIMHENNEFLYHEVQHSFT